MLPDLPEDFITRMTDLHGPAARDWLAGLPDRIHSLEERWGIQVAPHLQALSYNYIAPARRQDGTPAMLKLGFPGIHLEREAACLRWFGGDGAAILLEFDAGLGAMLLERINPGTDIKHLPEEQAVQAVASVMRKIHKPTGPNPLFPTVQDWGKGFQRLRQRFAGGSGPLPQELVSDGEAIYDTLADSMQAAMLLHGDLHHENVLAAERDPWLVIDPQGVIGEPAFELGAYLHNPIPAVQHWPELGRILARRVALFSEVLGIERGRIAGWGFARAVLSAIWDLEDHGSGWEAAILVARQLREHCDA